MSFCYLEKDKKTFEYFKEYLRHLESSTSSCFILDNQIQVREMCDHLYSNGYTVDDDGAVIEWVKNNAENFRNYLNTIKLVYVVWKCMGNTWDDINWDNFIRIEDNINQLKSTCLDTIF